MVPLCKHFLRVVDATPVKVTAPLPPQSPEVEEQVEEQVEDEVVDDLDMGLGLEEALQGTFTSKPVEEKQDESKMRVFTRGCSVCVRAC